MTEEVKKEEKPNKLEKAKGICKSLFRYSDKINKILYIIIVAITLSVLKSLFQSSIEGDFILYQKDKEGKTEIGVIRAKKLAPPAHNKNLLTVKVDTELSRTVTYQRNVYDAFGYQIYAGGTVGQNRYGGGIVGIAVTVSF